MRVYQFKSRYPAQQIPQKRICVRSAIRTLLATTLGMAAVGAIANPPQAPAPDPQTPAAGPEAITAQGINGELMHALLGLSMQQPGQSDMRQEIISAFPADRNWQRLPDPNSAWTTVVVFQHYRMANGDYPAESDLTPDGNFYLARSSFIYQSSTSMGGIANPDGPSTGQLEWVLPSSVRVPVEVSENGITLGNRAELAQGSLRQEDNTYELEATAARPIARTDIIPFDSDVQTYRDRAGSGSYRLTIKKGSEPRQVKLCLNDAVASVIRTVCHVWTVPANWTFGKALNFDRSEVSDMRHNFPSELTEGGPMYWVTGSQNWPRL